MGVPGHRANENVVALVGPFARRHNRIAFVVLCPQREELQRCSLATCHCPSLATAFETAARHLL